MSLILKNIEKSFKGEAVLSDVSLSVETGKTLVLFGPSGAGKTVLLRLIAGVIEPDHGEIIIDDQNMVGVEPEERGVGMAFQNFALFPHMDAFKNIASPLEAQRADKNAIKDGVMSVAKLLKIDHVLSHAPKALSNGQKQRTALARALAGQPKTLLLDDPLRNVDAKLRFEMRLELPRLLAEQNATVIYVTQDYKEAMALGDQIAVMNGHGIQQIGTPEEIYYRPANTDIARLFGDPVINLLEVTPRLTGEGLSVSISGVDVPIDPGYAACENMPSLIGIRPEAIRFAQPDEAGAVAVEIEAETPLNEKTVTLALTKGGREILLSRPSGTPAPTSGEAHIAFDTNMAMLFDQNTKSLITPSVKGQSL